VDLRVEVVAEEAGRAGDEVVGGWGGWGEYVAGFVERAVVDVEDADAFAEGLGVD